MPKKDLKAKFAAALFNWREEAKRMKEQSACHPNAFTTTEFAVEAGVSPPTAFRRLKELEKKGLIRTSRKLLRGKPVDAWVEVKA